MAQLRSGDLTRYVLVQSRSASQDASGQQLTTWADVKSVYAHIEAMNGRELVAAQAVQSDVTHSITVRYDSIWADPKLAATYRIVYKNRYFNISAVMNSDESDAVITLLASEGLNLG